MSEVNSLLSKEIRKKDRVNVKIIIKEVFRYRFFYFLVLPSMLWVFLFRYLPMYGISLAFVDYNFAEGLIGSKWVGFKYFLQLFNTEMFRQALWNTMIISMYKMVSGFIFPILLALMLNEITKDWYKRTLQTAVYLPRFVSWVVYGGIILLLLSPETGLVNKVIEFIGGKPKYFLGEPAYFRSILMITDAMKEAGWGAVVYIAAITSIDIEMYESAKIDGVNMFQKIWYITLPGIASTIIVMLIIRLGYILNAGLDQVLNLYNPMVLQVGDILDTYIYRQGVEQFNLSLATAADLFKAIIGFILVIITNTITKKINSDTGIV